MARKPVSSEMESLPEPDRAGPGLARLLPILCLVGAALAIHLAVIHYGVWFGNLSLGAVCGAAGGDCGGVVASRFGQLLGVPVAIWGLAFYVVAGTLALALVLLRREETPPFARALLWISAVALAFDAYLGWVMWARLETMCPLCIATYAVNLLILVIVALERRGARGDDAWRLLSPDLRVLADPLHPSYHREALKLVLAGGAAAALMVVFLGSLAIRTVAARGEEAQMRRLVEHLPGAESIFVPTQGRPARGPATAPVTIVVFSDFLCDRCREASQYLEVVAANHRRDVRVVYRQLPGEIACNPNALTSPHPGACRLAAAAECAHLQNRFWEFHDAVFRNTAKISPERIPSYLSRAGIDRDRYQASLADSAWAAQVRGDVALAQSLGVNVTPTLFINGRAIVGALKPRMLEEAIRVIAALAPPSAEP
jgi:protein-disulfide isomerase/uncharacterized membrane protein